ncbi:MULTISPECIES: carbohydrate porin [unclassified Sphingomonas]|uniref:carbohydrate porin n=1 Tax=unclassified Sphingomonas TaxID=196159 RepID=UPI00226A9FAC|nr:MULTISPECIES: carbohydrate porin [unclassified Sphingomonas]
MPVIALATALLLAAPTPPQSAPQTTPPDAAQLPDGAAPTTNAPPLTGEGDRGSAVDPAAAFSSGNREARPADQSKTPTGFGRFQRDNPIGKELRALKQGGVDLTLDYVENFAANPVGGISHGTAESHWVMGAADLDLYKLVGIPNTKVHIQGAWFTGESLGRNSIGNSISFQQTWRPVSGPRLTQLNIEHDFGKLNVMVGRAAVNSYFNSSPLNCVFMSNTACLTAYGGISDIGITAYPNSSWAAKVRYAVNDRWYAQVGAFDYNNDLNLKGKDGVDFSLGEGTGVLVPAEIGYQTTFANDRLPRRYKLGFYYNSDGGQSPFYDRNGGSAALTGLARIAQQPGSRMGWYAMVDQTVQRDAGDSKRNLALFGRVFLNTGNVAQLDWFGSAGFVKTGTFGGRDNDTVGFLVSNTHFSDQEIAYLRDLRARNGGTGAPKVDEIVGEINYGFAALPGLRLMPNLQYVINPDPINAPKRTTDIPAAIVLGLRVDVHFAQLFGG